MALNEVPTLSQSDTPQVATPAVAGTSANAEVLSDSQNLAVQPPIVPLPAHETLAFLGLKPSINDMTLDEKFACLKQCFAYGYGIRKILVEVFESIVSEYKTYVKDRKGMPTVEEAFKQRGLNYKTVYSAIQREKERRTEDAQFFAELKAQSSTNNIHGLEVTDDDLPPIGEKVVDEGGRHAVVLAHGVAGGGKTVEVIYEDDGTSEILKPGRLVRLAEIMAAKAAAKAAKGNRKNDNGPKGTPDAQSLKNAYYADRYKEVIALMANKPKDAKAEDVLAQIEAEAIRAYEDMGADEAKSLRIPKPKHTKLEQMGIKVAKLVASNCDLGRKLPRTRSDGWKLFDLAADLLKAAGEDVEVDAAAVDSGLMEKSKLEANDSVSFDKSKKPTTKAKKVFVARIGDTTEFGVFPDSCDEHTTTNALTIGTKQACEAERDRLNAKRAANAEPLGVLLAAANPQVQQKAVSIQ